MILLLLRIGLTGAFVYCLWTASGEASANLNNDVLNAGRFALAIIVGFGAAFTWAPLLGESIAGPVTGLMTDGSVSDHNSWLVGLIRRYEARGWRRLTVFLSFLEGVRRPHMPAAFVLGMNNSRPGSWLEKAFAREVWKFNSVANCLRAHDVLALRHDERPDVHPVPEVNLALLAHLREPRPDAEIIAVRPADAPPPLRRKASIRLFAGADSGEPTPRV